MANPQRAAQLTKLHKVLKSHYKPLTHNVQLPLLELMAFGSLLENSSYDAAEVVYARLTQRYHDWNEVRVSTVTELSETLEGLFEPSARATQLKKVLQGVFEAKYTFEIEILKKANLGAAVQELEKITGCSPFIISFVAQNGLGGHSIGLDRGAWELLIISGMATPQEAATGALSGLERTIPKNKGVEFFSILHQAGAEYLASPHSPEIKKLMAALTSTPVWPKRGESALKLPDPPPKKPVAKAPEVKGKTPDKSKSPTKPADAKHPDKGGKTAGKSDTKATTKGKEPSKPTTAKADDKAKPSKPADSKSGHSDHGKKPTAKSKPAPAPKKPSNGIKSPTKQLAKRKPR